MPPIYFQRTIFIMANNYSEGPLAGMALVKAAGTNEKL